MKVPLKKSALRQRGEVSYLVLLISRRTVTYIYTKRLGFGIAYIPAPLVLEDLRTK